MLVEQDFVHLFDGLFHAEQLHNVHIVLQLTGRSIQVQISLGASLLQRPFTSALPTEGEVLENVSHFVFEISPVHDCSVDVIKLLPLRVFTDLALVLNHGLHFGTPLKIVSLYICSKRL